MPLRVLQHGFSGATESVGLEPGRWSDVAAHGQFLLDLEFLLRCAPASGTASCVYCKSPTYLREIAQQFPWIHFYAFEHAHAVPEYDPAQPALACSVPLTVQVVPLSACFHPGQGADGRGGRSSSIKPRPHRSSPRRWRARWASGARASGRACS